MAKELGSVRDHPGATSAAGRDAAARTEDRRQGKSLRWGLITLLIAHGTIHLLGAVKGCSGRAWSAWRAPRGEPAGHVLSRSSAGSLTGAAVRAHGVDDDGV